MKKYGIQSVRGRRTPNGYKRIWRIRSGAKGKGKILYTIVVWPWSRKSIAEGHKMISEFVDRLGDNTIVSLP